MGSTLLFLCILIIIITMASSTGSAKPPQNLHYLGNETDRAALLAFKSQITQDPHNMLKNSWNDSLHFCSWHGITCDRHHKRVVRLELTSKGLVGSLSPYISNLTYLHTIILAKNKLHGEIPSEIAHLSFLQYLDISNNYFTGEIPRNLSSCSNLRTIDLSYNKLKGQIPEELGFLSNLVTLFLFNNNLTGKLQSSFGNLSSLESLFLDLNNLDGSIPESFGKMKTLKKLGLSSNMFSSLFPPPVFLNLSELQVFSIANNKFYGNLPPNLGHNLPYLNTFFIGENQFFGSIPASLLNVSTLQMFDIDSNNFTGEVPSTVGSLKGLIELNLGYNYLGGITQESDSKFLSSLINCSRLQTLILESNHFSAILPNSIVNFSRKLTQLYIGGNQISGKIPSEIGNLENLFAFDLYGNFLTGGIPFEIGKLSRLQELGLEENKLSGKIPSSMGNLSQLFYLDLSINNLDGEILPSISNCRSLQRLHLNGNNLSGKVPSKVLIDLSSHLLHLTLDHNSLIGPLPPEVGNLANLVVLDVSNNKMSGTIPTTLGNCLSLQGLSLSRNSFQGSIPSSLNNLKDLQTLDLSMNNFSGPIPLYLQNLSSLQNLNLSFNNLEGDVPLKGVFENATAFSVLGNNHLCGGIQKLQLPICPVKDPKHRGISLAIKLSLGAIFMVILIITSVLFIWHYHRKMRIILQKPPTKNFWEDRFRRVSYNELYQATNGFASGNLIGRGRFGLVYRGMLKLDHQTEESIAVKVFNLIEQGASKSFISECETLRKVRHRNLLKILTVCSGVDFQGNDFRALVLKFMPNGSLEKWLHSSSSNEGISSGNVLNLSQRINIAIDIASALDYLHNHFGLMPIIHCDLKPSNILLDEEMTAYVGDFGLAKVLTSGSTGDSNHQFETNSSILGKGTIGYIPPEYGLNIEVSTQGDAYSYGILLLEMFTGKRPTNDMFKDHLNLHYFSKMAFPNQVMTIADPNLFFKNDDEAFDAQKESVKEWLGSIIRIGVACSMESPSDRMDVKGALRELQMIKRSFHAESRMQELPQHQQ